MKRASNQRTTTHQDRKRCKEKLTKEGSSCHAKRSELGLGEHLTENAVLQC